MGKMTINAFAGRLGRATVVTAMVLGLAACAGGSSSTSGTGSTGGTSGGSTGGGGSSGSSTTATTAQGYDAGLIPAGATLPDKFTFDDKGDNDPSNDEIIITNGSSTLATLTRTSLTDLGSFKSYSDSTNAVWADGSSSGDVGALLLLVPAASGGGSTGQVAGVYFSRNSDGTIPNSGSASFSGSYAGFLSTGDASHLYDLVRGDASLSVDFGAGTVSGSITNREYFDSTTDTTQPADGTLNDLTLSNGTFGSNGTYSGDATGGEISGTDTTSNGGFVGLFGGDNGKETAGAVQIDHSENSTSSDAAVETGAFVAEQ
jgi:hypothetical protein